MTTKVDDLLETGHPHSVAVKDLLNMAGQKRIKLCSSESSANAVKSHKLRHNDTKAPQPWEIKFSVVFALSLT